MSIRIQDIVPQPLLPIAYPSYGDGKLSENQEKFIGRVHAKLFYNKVRTSQYGIDLPNAEIEFQGTNQTEQDAINKVSRDALELATIMAEEIQSWIQASLRGLKVAVPHFEAETPGSPPQHAALAGYYFTV